MLRIFSVISYFARFGNLYRFLVERFLISIRNTLHISPPFPSEPKYTFDNFVADVLDKIERQLNSADMPDIPNAWRGPELEAREVVGHRISIEIQRILPYAVDSISLSSLERLKEIGVVELPNFQLKDVRCETIVNWLKNRNVYPAHVCQRSLRSPKSLEWVKKRKRPFGAYDYETICQVPEFLSLLSNKTIINTIAAYFGCLPTVSSMNTYWSFKQKDNASAGPQHFHRDVEDYRQCNLFVILTPTSPSDGSYRQIRYSHDPVQARRRYRMERNKTLPAHLNPYSRFIESDDFYSLPFSGPKGYGYNQLYNHFFSDQVEEIFGQPGRVVLTDGYGLHRASVPKSRSRCIFWVTYLLRNNVDTAYQSGPQPGRRANWSRRITYDKVNHIVPNDNETRYVLRNIVNFN